MSHMNDPPPSDAAVESGSRTEDNDAMDGNAGFKIAVLYNGVSHKILIEHHEVVKSVLAKAIASFGNLPNPHTLSLFLDGKELDDNLTAKKAGIKRHAELLLRPSAVKGGGA